MCLYHTGVSVCTAFVCVHVCICCGHWVCVACWQTVANLVWVPLLPPPSKWCGDVVRSGPAGHRVERGVVECLDDIGLPSWGQGGRGTAAQLGNWTGIKINESPFQPSMWSHSVNINWALATEYSLCNVEHTKPLLNSSTQYLNIKTSPVTCMRAEQTMQK